MQYGSLKQEDFRGASLHSSPGNAARMGTCSPDFPPGLEGVPGALGDRTRNRLRDGGSRLRIAEIDFGLPSASRWPPHGESWERARRARRSVIVLGRCRAARCPGEFRSPDSRSSTGISLWRPERSSDRRGRKLMPPWHRTGPVPAPSTNGLETTKPGWQPSFSPCRRKVSSSTFPAPRCGTHAPAPGRFRRVRCEHRDGMATRIGVRRAPDCPVRNANVTAH